MVNVIKYSLTNETGFVEYTLHYFVHNKEVTEQRTFTNEDNARRYFHSTQRTVFLQHIENYVNHKKFIIEGGDQRFNMAVQESLALCVNYVQWANGNKSMYDPSIDAICKYGLQIQKHLEKILPSQRNSSYMSSRDNLQQIIHFCKNWKESYNQLKQAA